MKLEEVLDDVLLVLHLAQCPVLILHVAVTGISVKAGSTNGGKGSLEAVLDVNGNDSQYSGTSHHS